MEATLLSGYAETTFFPILMDSTTLEKPDQVRQGFETAKADVTAIFWTGAFVVEKRERRLPSPEIATGPCKASALPRVLDATGDDGDGLARLEIAAEIGDETAFVQAAGGIDWSQVPAADFARAVRLALAAGAHLLARNLADQGHGLHPHHEELAKMARILAPPRVVNANLPPDPSARANLEWMRVHAAEYRGRWVALKKGVLLASAPTARQLRDQLPATDGLFLTRVI